MNPLKNRLPGDLLDDVETFYRNQKLKVVIDLITLQKGALIARDPTDFESQHSNGSNDSALGTQDSNDSNDTAPGAQGSNGHETPFKLTEAEKSAISDEKDSSWFFQTRELRVTILATACAAITQYVDGNKAAYNRASC